MPGHHRLQGHGKFQSLEQDKNAVIICNVIEGPPERSPHQLFIPWLWFFRVTNLVCPDLTSLGLPRKTGDRVCFHALLQHPATLWQTPLCTFLEHILIACAHTSPCASLCLVCEAPGLSQTPLEYLAPPERASDFPVTEFSSHG